MILRVIIDVLIVIGAIFSIAGVIGVIKMPDFYSRMQTATCISTLGVGCVALAMALYAGIIKGSSGDTVKIVLIALIITLTSPLGTHVVTKGAYKNGVRPDKPLEPDDLGRDFDD